MKIFNLLNKIFAGIYNFAPINLSPIKNIKQESTKPKKNKIVVIIDYDKFSNRTLKTVGKISYACGAKSIKLILNHCINNNIDYMHLITTDIGEVKNSTPNINEKSYIKNNGTDISALASIIDILHQYETVIVANSSCAVDDARRFGELVDAYNSITSKPFIIGFNANSRISPRIPILTREYPHIITNLFKTRSKELIEILTSEKNHKYPISKSGFGNKYFAIRYFEISLSAWILYNDGDLVLILDNGTHINYKNSKWPTHDTRLTRFSTK